MNILNRLKKIETVNSSSEFCTCGHKNKVKIKTVKSDSEAGTIAFVFLPCERCHKLVQADFPPSITFDINPNVKMTREA
jgi:hypothetical protein